MAHRCIALDIGSHSVKVLIAESKFAASSFKVRYYLEEYLEPADQEDPATPAEGSDTAGQTRQPSPQPPGGNPLPPQALAALERLKARGVFEGDTLAVSYDLGHCLQTQLELPPGLRREKIDEILAVQIEDHYPIEPAGLVSEIQMAGEVTPGGQRRVLVISAPVEALSTYLEALSKLGINPGFVDVGPARLLAAYRTLVTELPTSPVALIDVGCEGTDVCFVEDDQVVNLRRLPIGGRHFTQALADHFHISLDQAEQLKCSQGFVGIGDSSGPTTGDPTRQMGQVCRQVAALLANELNWTLHSHMAHGGKTPERLYFCGGGSHLDRLVPFLALSVNLPADLLKVPDVEPFAPGADLKATGAWGLAARALGRRPASQLNLRRGPLAYRGDYEFLQNRIPLLIVLFALLLGTIVFSTLTQRSALVARRNAFEETLVALSEPVFGERVSTPGEVVSRLQQATSGSILLPEVSAYELFTDVSLALVDLRELGVPVTVQLMTIDIQRDVLTMRGSTDSAISVDEIMSELNGLECLDEVTQERTTQNRSTGQFDFELRAVNTCS